jgi:lipopolysaccharide/colanic/teichoic acid biosynthesis glycosyltransferase
MISWLRRRAEAKWTRRTAWTPLLLTQRQLQRVLAKERMRADREGNVFGLIILRVVDLRNVRMTSLKLAKILHHRLRETDEKGHLNYGRIGVVLPSTNDEGTQLVLADVLRLAAAAGLPIEGEAFVYPERPRRIVKSDGADSIRVDDERADEGEKVSVQVGAQASENVEIDNVETFSDNVQPVAPQHVGNSASEHSQHAGSHQHVASYHDVVARREIVAPLPTALLVTPYPLWKRSVDFLGALIGLIAASPFILMAALIIRLTSPGPAFFAQQRVGYLGRRFWIYKLRTMVANAEELKVQLLERNERDGPAFKMRQDPRITRFGRLLRATGLDELPQLFNVLIGDMSLVGPRPLPVSEAEQCLPWQRARMHTKPGLTCYWQLAKTRKMSFVEWMRLDMRYARARNLWLDTKLILGTVSAVLLGRVGH